MSGGGASWAIRSAASPCRVTDAVGAGGAAASDVSQLVGVAAGDRFDLLVTAAASGEPGAVVEPAFGDDTGLSVGAAVGLPGVSTRLAVKIIASAAELVRTRGERVLVGT
jgi:hypothetical protein